MFSKEVHFTTINYNIQFKTNIYGTYSHMKKNTFICSIIIPSFYIAIDDTFFLVIWSKFRINKTNR